MRLGYFWTDCPDGSHVAVNYAIHEEGVTGSIRRWSRDTRVNVGRKFEVPASELIAGPGGEPMISLEGVCGEAVRIALDPAAAAEAGLIGKTAA